MTSNLITDFSIQTTMREVGADVDGVPLTKIYQNSTEYLQSQISRYATQLNLFTMLNQLTSAPVFVCNGQMSLSARPECFL